jgi:hypothetical protein
MGMYCWWWLVDKFGGCTHILEIINELAIPQFFTAMVLTIAQIVVQLGLLFLEKETDILLGFWKWGGWILGGTTILGNFHCGGFRVISTYLPDEVPAVRDFLTINGGIWCWPVTVWQDIKSWHNTKGPKRVHFLGDSDQMILTWSGLHLENSLVSCFWSFGDMSQSSRCAARGIPFWWTILLVEYCASSRNLVTVVTLQCSSWVWAMTQTYPDPTGDDHPLLTQLDRWHKRIGMACMTTTNSPATWPCHICIYTYIYSIYPPIIFPSPHGMAGVSPRETPGRCSIPKFSTAQGSWTRCFGWSIAPSCWIPSGPRPVIVTEKAVKRDQRNVKMTISSGKMMINIDKQLINNW